MLEDDWLLFDTQIKSHIQGCVAETCRRIDRSAVWLGLRGWRRESDDRERVQWRSGRSTPKREGRLRASVQGGSGDVTTRANS